MTASSTVLVVEDDDDSRELLAMILRSHGFAVREADSGATALHALAAVAPDTVIIDLGLPDMDGVELAAAIRGNPALARTRIVALSGSSTPSSIESCEHAGFHEYLLKPADMDVLLRVLKRARP